MKIDIIAGARPNFIKIAPIIDAIKAKKADGFDINYTGRTGSRYNGGLRKVTTSVSLRYLYCGGRCDINDGLQHCSQKIEY
jgi:hypothetical protein